MNSKPSPAIEQDAPSPTILTGQVSQQDTAAVASWIASKTLPDLSYIKNKIPDLSAITDKLSNLNDISVNFNAPTNVANKWNPSLQLPNSSTQNISGINRSIPGVNS